MSIAGNIYAGAANIGKVYAWITAVIFTFIGVGIILLGAHVIKHKAHLTSVNGIVTKGSDDCMITTTNNNDTISTCAFEVMYRKTGSESRERTYTSTLTSSSIFAVGDTVLVWYDPNYPEQCELKPISGGIGWGMIACAVLLILGAWCWVWLTSRYKIAAAVGGARALTALF
jgi:hypothetical protein